MSNQKKGALIDELGLAVMEEQDARDALDEAAVELLGINRSDLRCLGALARGPMAAGELATAVGLTPGAVTTMLDRMERAGRVRRVRDTADRRRVLVEVTPETRQLLAEIWGPIAEAGRAILQGYDLEELNLLRDFLHRNRQLQLEQAERIRKLRAPQVAAGPGDRKGRRRGG